MRKTLLLFFFGMGITGFVLAQAPTRDIVSTAGGSAKTDAMSIDWTIGEPVIGTAAGKDRLYTQGFQQPTLQVKQIMVDVKARNNDADIAAYDITVTPNPVLSTLTVNLKTPGDETLDVQILDVQSQTVYLGTIDPGMSTTHIDVSSYPSGMYVLRVFSQRGEPVSAFKVSKIQN